MVARQAGRRPAGGAISQGQGWGRGGATAGAGFCARGPGVPGGSPVVGRLGGEGGGPVFMWEILARLPPRVSPRPSLPLGLQGGGFSGPRRPQDPATGPWSPSAAFHPAASGPPALLWPGPQRASRSHPRSAGRCQDTPDTPIYSAGVGEEEAAIRGDLEKELGVPSGGEGLGQPDTPTRQPRLRHGVGAAEVLNVGRVQPPFTPRVGPPPGLLARTGLRALWHIEGPGSRAPAHPAGALSVAVQPPGP